MQKLGQGHSGLITLHASNSDIKYGGTSMRQFIRIVIISSSLLVTTLMSGCIVVPGGGRHCGHYHCW
jgi:hypothetical protein